MKTETIRHGDGWVTLIKPDAHTSVARAATDEEIAAVRKAALPDQDGDGVPDIVEAQQARRRRRKAG